MLQQLLPELKDIIYSVYCRCGSATSFSIDSFVVQVAILKSDAHNFCYQSTDWKGQTNFQRAFIKVTVTMVKAGEIFYLSHTLRLNMICVTSVFHWIDSIYFNEPPPVIQWKFCLNGNTADCLCCMYYMTQTSHNHIHQLSTCLLFFFWAV